MKKIIIALFALFIAIVAPLSVTFAANLSTVQGLGTVGNTGDPGVVLGKTDVVSTVDNLTNWFFAAFLIVAVWFLILAAFHFVTANGETEKVNTARNEVMYAMIGVLIAVLAKGIVALATGLAKAG